MKVHIFNPENDMALADGQPGYTPPASIRQMRHDLAWLPKWWAEEADIVWDGKEPLHLQPGDEIRPWGWSPALIHQLRQAGVTDEFLPDDGTMERLRQLSHRQTAVEALGAMHDEGLIGHWLCGESRLCHSVVVEQRLTRLVDFALLFRLDGQGGVEYRGLSMFHTDEAGKYTGNWLAPEGEKLQWLMQYVPPQVLMDVRRWWEERLRHYDYRGPMGVDMMLAREGLCPCIETNWRMTMGHVAQLLTEQGHRGKLLVQYIYGQYCAEVEAFQ